MLTKPVFPALVAPKAEKRPRIEVRHGVELTDDHGWLRAANWQEVLKDPSLLADDIRAHLEAENAYQQAVLADTEELCKVLFEEMKGRIKEDDSSIPMKDGPYAYGSAFRKGGQHPYFFRQPTEGGEEMILLDGDREAEGTTYFNIGSVEHAPDHRRLLWSADHKGSEFYTLHLRDLETGSDLTDRIENTAGSGAFDAGSDGFFYTLVDDNHRPSKVFYHRIGEDAANDRLVYEETDAGFFMSVGASLANDWIMISIHDHETSEYRILPAATPDAEPKLVAPRETGLQYDLEAAGNEFFILTNADGAKDFKIVRAPAADPSRANWSEVVPHQPGRLIIGMVAFKDHLVRIERVDGLPRIVIRERATGAEHAIAFDEEAYSLGLIGAAEYDTETIRFTYSSMTTPTQEFDYNMRTRERTLLKTQEVPSGHDPSDYVTRRLMAPAEDGALVPISLLYRKDIALDGSAPCLLYGYGSYGITIPASFRTAPLSLVDRGFVYAIAHVRGGKDKGFSWYEDGKRSSKMNTFTDFIACARHLVAENYTSHDRLVAEGGSAGGMLMGAVANMAPEAFRAIVAQVPFVDVLNTMLDDTLPLTPPEWPEWGNPLASAEDFALIRSYSPYDNVAPRAYPAIFALAGLTDPRVTYWEPAKWVAKLREHNAGDQPILLRTNLEAGHAGASGRFSRLEEVALAYAFMLKVTGMMKVIGKPDSRSAGAARI
ncbi:S9 family peptidase [Nitratireductor luteus]|uniref:S9 family peptidase n=1 Tax=Nitratireductor luteus TaxID=2976980 RepID=UPI00223F9B3F|nr:S9 family peptidase [Nitratireductor luteus]